MPPSNSAAACAIDNDGRARALGIQDDLSARRFDGWISADERENGSLKCAAAFGKSFQWGRYLVARVTRDLVARHLGS